MTVQQRKKFADKKMMLMPDETRQGIEVTGNKFIPLLIKWFVTHIVKSFVKIVEYLFSVPGVKSFMSSQLSQDPLEKFFGCQRHWGKSSENPNVYEFYKNTQALRVINSVCGNVPRGNCRGSNHTIDWQAESKQLPKCRRPGSENRQPEATEKCDLQPQATGKYKYRPQTTGIVTTNPRLLRSMTISPRL